MSRPTKERVDATQAISGAGVDVDELRAELDVCKRELAESRDALSRCQVAERERDEARGELREREDLISILEDECDGLRAELLEAKATIARVEALLAKWRERHPNRVLEGKCGTDAEFCTDELEKALRGEQ